MPAPLCSHAALRTRVIRNIRQKIRTGTYVRPQETYARKKSHYENVTHDLQPQQCILTD
jgi:hypothetical protein